MFASIANGVTPAPALIAYLASLAALMARGRPRLDLLWAGLAGSLPAGVLVLGCGGLVMFEARRLTGSSFDAGAWYVLGLGTGLGLYLGVGLAALAAGGVVRIWLPIAAALLAPAVLVTGSPSIRAEVAGQAAAFNYALVIVLFATFAAVAWPRVRARWLEVHEASLDNDRGDQKAVASDATRTNDPGAAAAKAALQEQIDASLKGVAVALSGGGHRAALFDLGVLLYLVRAGKHREVTQIASVSGGSLTNGYVASSVDFRSCAAGEFERMAWRFAGQISDRGTLFGFWQSRLYVVAAGLTGIVTAAAWAVWIRPPSWLPETWLIPAGAIGAALMLGYVVSQRGAVCRWAFRRSLYTRGERPAALRDVTSPPLHVFCATELQTGNGAYFVKAPFVSIYDRGPVIDYFPAVVSQGFGTTIMDVELATAVQASAALPGAFPPVALPVHGRLGITRRPVSRIWERLPSSTMLLVDGGVRDNLGVEWFLSGDRDGTWPLIVVNGAANKVAGREARVSSPWLGDLRALLLVKDIPYTIREQNRRHELLGRFLPGYRGQAGDITGAILHIEESPYDLAEALDRGGRRDLAAFLETPEDTRIGDALRQRPDFEAIRLRAAAVRARLEQAEDATALRKARAERRGDQLDPDLAALAPIPLLVSQEWHRRAHANSTVSTTLRALGRPVSAALIRHAFALAMAKLHILFEYPLCDLPSEEELQRAIGDAGP